MTLSLQEPLALRPSELPVWGVPAWVGDTSVSVGETKSVLTRASGFMGEYDYTLNPYSGCSFGCTYCYAAFFSRDVGLRDSWGDWAHVKGNLAAELHRRLSRKPELVDDQLIYMSSVTDPYQPVERKVGLTRRLLEVFAGCIALEDAGREAEMPQGALVLEESSPLYGVDAPRPKLVVQTRSPDVVRDIDLFRQIVANGGRVQVNMTVTSDLANDEDVRRAFEPGCPSNRARLSAIAKVQAAGVQSCITMTPLLLVDDVDLFADDLLATGVTRYIIQPFHFSRGKFVAQTRRDAFELMAERLGCEGDDFVEEYLLRYGAVRDGLKVRLVDEAGCMLSEGKSGFAPPF